MSSGLVQTLVLLPSRLRQRFQEFDQIRFILVNKPRLKQLS
jgi:hypothetical protein